MQDLEEEEASVKIRQVVEGHILWDLAEHDKNIHDLIYCSKPP